MLIYLGWLTDQHIGLSVRVDWPTNIPAYPCRLTDRPTYLNICIRADWQTNMPEYLSELTDRRQPICPTNIPAYPSGLTDWPTYLTIYLEWLTNQHTWLSGLTDRPTYPPFYLDWLTNIPDYLPLLKCVYCQCVVCFLPVHSLLITRSDFTLAIITQFITSVCSTNFQCN